MPGLNRVLVSLSSMCVRPEDVAIAGHGKSQEQRLLDMQTVGIKGSDDGKACADWSSRRKKCDEAQPACLACESRSITCHGYSVERPPWMDSGVLEKAEHDKIKNAVAENKKRQRKIFFHAQAEARINSASEFDAQQATHTQPSMGREMLVRDHGSSRVRCVFSECCGCVFYGTIYGPVVF